jgi:hypothetical protein
MTERKVNIPTAQISQDISNFTIGLAKLSVHDRVEDALCAGSGTLASIGHVDGLLTAAHVLNELPKEGDVGIILYRDRSLQKQVIKMENTDQVVIRGEIFGADGPDLGFLRIPHENVGWLKATNSFYNLTKRRDQVLAKETPASYFADAVIGMIDEFTKEIPVSEPKKRAKMFSAIFCNGSAKDNRDSNGYDLMDVEVTSYPDFPLPNSFEGMSGGALWRIYFNEENDVPSIVERRLFGVPFHQSLAQDGARIITCHGPVGIYRTLIDEVSKKWPNVG